MTTEQQLADKIREVALFCLTHKGRCFENWTGHKVFFYLSFHTLAGTIFVLRNSHRTIEAVAVCWLGDAAEFLRREHDGEPQFAWTLPPKGNALMIANVFGVRSACKRLWSMAFKEWPNVKRCFAYRRKAGHSGDGVLVEWPLSKVRRFCV